MPRCVSSTSVNWREIFKNGLSEGQGKYTIPDGSIYEGEFKNGIFEGHGKFTYSDGLVYEGEFKNDKFEGQGKS